MANVRKLFSFFPAFVFLENGRYIKCGGDTQRQLVKKIEV